MESLDAPAGFMDDLLDFSSDIGEEEEDDGESNKSKTLTTLPLSLLASRGLKTSAIVEEEELEWISNKDAFPMVESFVDIMPNHHRPSFNNHQSPVSVLENSTSSFNSSVSNNTANSGVSGGGGITTAIVSLSSNLKVPVRARSKRRKRRRELFSGQQWRVWAKVPTTTTTHKISKPRAGPKASSTLGRKCMHCQTEKTPQWRAGPLGPKTLCNACGVRYKSGRLVPEYRPASSPTFLSEVHSNSHRKIVEMRKQMQVVVKPGVGLKPLEIG